MRKILISSVAALLLAGCAAITAVQTGQPLDQAQVQKDLAISLQVLQEAGCFTAIAGAAAAPIVAVSADADGNKMLTAVGATGAAVCSAPAPAAVVSAPGTTLGAVVAAPAR